MRWVCSLLPLLVWAGHLAEAASPQSTGLYCECHVASNRGSNIGIHCVKNETRSSHVSCRNDVTPELPPGYRHVPGYAMVKLYRLRVWFDEARLICEKDGGRLAIPPDKEAILGLQQLFASYPNLPDAYIGISDQQTESVYQGVNGHPAPYLTWSATEPNVFDDAADCVLLNRDGLMSVVVCDQRMPFLCERELRSRIPPDYHWVEGASRFVSIHDEQLGHEEAKAVCERDGATLLVVDTWRRAEAILELLPVTSNEIYRLGLDDRQNEGDFVTADGRHMSDMEFQVWKLDEPSGYSKGFKEDCLTIESFGFFNDNRCDAPRRFICEIQPV